METFNLHSTDIKTRCHLSCPVKSGRLYLVFFRRQHKPRERFYLFPGQGGRMYRRKQQRIMRWTLAVALVFGGALAVALWLFSRPKPF